MMLDTLKTVGTFDVFCLESVMLLAKTLKRVGILTSKGFEPLMVFWTSKVFEPLKVIWTLKRD